MRFAPASTPAAFIRQSLAGGYGAGYAALCVSVVLIQAADTLAPWFLGKLIGALVADPRSFPTVAMAALVASWSLSWLFTRAYQWLDRKIMPPLRGHAQLLLTRHLFSHSPRFFGNNLAGALGQMTKQAAEGVIQVLSHAGYEGPRVAMLSVLSLIMLASVMPAYAAFFALWMVAFVALSARHARRSAADARVFTKAASTLSGQMVDTLANVEVARSFARLGDEWERLGVFIGKEAEASQKLRRFLSNMSAVQGLSTLALMSAFLVMAAHDARDGRIGVGDLATVIALGLVIVQTVQNLSLRMLDFFVQFGTLREALSVISTSHEVSEAPDAMPLQVRQGRIDFEGVNFAHPGGPPVFAGLDLKIRAGEKIGLVGRSGAGKSTLIHLLQRHYDCAQGSIRIDDQDIRRVTLDSLATAMVVVPQTPGIFHRSLRENIMYGRPDADERTLLSAAEAAHCVDFAVRRDEGFDTLVGEHGIKLSGGERQRVAIARALLKEARILILDEATSALDSESEHVVQDALWRMFADKTVIAIAHRLSTLARMDRLIVLDAGRIVEEGSHHDLIARNGLYAELWNRQAGGFLKDE